MIGQLERQTERPLNANELIERLERETGQRLDANNGDNLAMAGLFGAISRLLGYSPASYRERDDVAAGLVIKHLMSPAYQRQQAADATLAHLLAAGMSPDDIKEILG